MNVALIDYGTGNVHSLMKALEAGAVLGMSLYTGALDARAVAGEYGK